MITTYTPNNPLSEPDYIRYKKEINTKWRTYRRRYIAKRALDEIVENEYEKLEHGKIIFEDEELKGIISFKYLSEHIILTYLATKEKGYGLKLFKFVAEEALNKNLGIYVENASLHALGFYQKIGMDYKKENDFEIFSFDYKQLKMFMKGE